MGVEPMTRRFSQPYGTYGAAPNVVPALGGVVAEDDGAKPVRLDLDKGLFAGGRVGAVPPEHELGVRVLVVREEEGVAGDQRQNGQEVAVVAELERLGGGVLPVPPPGRRREEERVSPRDHRLDTVAGREDDLVPRRGLDGLESELRGGRLRARWPRGKTAFEPKRQRRGERSADGEEPEERTPGVEAGRDLPEGRPGVQVRRRQGALVPTAPAAPLERRHAQVLGSLIVRHRFAPWMDVPWATVPTHLEGGVSARLSVDERSRWKRRASLRRTPLPSGRLEAPSRRVPQE